MLQLLLLAFILFLNTTELILPPWTNQILMLWASTVATIVLVMLIVCRCIQNMLRKWILCLFIIAVFFSFFLYLVDPVDYYYATSFRNKMNGFVFSLDDDSIDKYKEYGDYTVSSEIQSSEIQTINTEHDCLILKGFQVTVPEGFEINEESAFLAILSSTDSDLLFAESFDYLKEFRMTVLACTEFLKYSEIQSAYYFNNNYELIHKMLMTTYKDVADTGNFKDLARKETLYASKVSALAIRPPVYEFNNGDVKGFLGQNKAVVFDSKNSSLLFEVQVRDKKQKTRNLEKTIFSIKKLNNSTVGHQ